MLFRKIKESLVKTSKNLTSNLGKIFQKGKKIDQSSLDELEEILIMSDMGVEVAGLLVEKVKGKKFPEGSLEEVEEFLRQTMLQILEGSTKALTFDQKPKVLFLCGVNGNGKTTTAGKLAQLFKEGGKKVLLGACDTFRAAAVEQLQAWGEKLDIPVVTGQEKSDPAAVCHKTIAVGQEGNYDLVILDTAGRLHTKKDLMLELEKSVKVLKKLDPEAQPEIFLVLDSTTGQNAYSQIENFSKTVQLSGLIFTKLDSSAKGGVILGAYRKYKIPIYALGLGEKADDLVLFDPESFIAGLL